MSAIDRDVPVEVFSAEHHATKAWRPSSSIAAANKEVKQVLDKTDKPEKNSKRGVYEHFILVDVVATNDGLYSVGAPHL